MVFFIFVKELGLGWLRYEFLLNIIDNFVISRKVLYFKGLVGFGVLGLGVVLWQGSSFLIGFIRVFRYWGRYWKNYSKSLEWLIFLENLRFEIDIVKTQSVCSLVSLYATGKTQTLVWFLVRPTYQTFVCL